MTEPFNDSKVVNALPQVLVGPMLRHVSSQQMVRWLAATETSDFRLS